MFTLQTLSREQRKLAIEILLILSGNTLSDCCDIIDVLCNYLNQSAIEGGNLNEIVFDFDKFIKCA